MAKVGAQRAAELTGKSKSTIQRAMKTGKISFEMDHNGRRVIDVAELERGFGLVPQSSEETETKAVEAELEKATSTLEIERLKMRVRFLEDQLDMVKEQMEDVKQQRDQWQKQAQQVLLTSQYSQKQAEELKAEMKEREMRAKMRRQKMEQQRGKAPMSKTGKQSTAGVQKAGLDIQNLWQKLRGQNDDKKTVATASSETTETEEKMTA